MADKSEVMIRAAEITGGATVTAAGMSFLRSNFLNDVGFLNNYPEVLPGVVVVGGAFARVADFGNDDLNNVVEGSIVAGTMGVVDGVLTRFGLDVY